MVYFYVPSEKALNGLRTIPDSHTSEIGLGFGLAYPKWSRPTYRRVNLTNVLFFDNDPKGDKEIAAKIEDAFEKVFPYRGRDDSLVNYEKSIDGEEVHALFPLLRISNPSPSDFDFKATYRSRKTILDATKKFMETDYLIVSTPKRAEIWKGVVSLIERVGDPIVEFHDRTSHATQMQTLLEQLNVGPSVNFFNLL